MSDIVERSHEWVWRDYFSKVNLDLGRRDAATGKLEGFKCDPEGAWAMGTTVNGFDVQVLHAPTTYEELTNYPAWNTLSTDRYVTRRNHFSHYYICTCSQGQMGMRCRHLANLMFVWELEHGPFIVVEDEAAYDARIKAEKEKREAEERARRLQQEKERKQKNVFPVIDYLLSRVQRAPRGLFYPPDAILRKAELLTDQYETELAEQLMSSEGEASVSIDPVFEPGQAQQLKAVGHFGDETAYITINRENMAILSCTCNRSRLRSYNYWYSMEARQGRMCGHALAAWTRFREAIIRENPGDETDYKGMQFLSLLADRGKAADDAPDIDEASPQRRRRCVVLVPRITRDKNNDSLKLNFDIGHAGERCYSVKGLQSLVNAADGESLYAVTKTVYIDFSREDFTEDAEAWFQLIQSRIRAVKSVNRKLQGSRYSYGSATLSVGAAIPLEESDLDIVYDLAQGGEIQYQYGTRNEVCTVPVGEAQPRAEIRLEPIQRDKALKGITVTGAMPRLLRGNLHQYILDRTCFGRIVDGETSFLKTMSAIADGEGTFRCAIGEKKLAEFYYRVLPSLQANPRITVVDKVGALIEGSIPPEPQFVFHLDIIDGSVTCDTHVSYNDFSFRMGDPLAASAPVPRDIDQEKRVQAVVCHFFSDTMRANGVPACPDDDDHLVWILTEGVATLSRYGEVMGSDAFQRVHIRPMPQPRFSVALEGGLVDLSIKTRDMSEDELLELLASYRLKKRWHRLGSGDFVDLRDTGGLDELAETAQAMDTTLEALIHGGVKLPQYRALYVERLLEAHHDVAASRDRQFKALVRAFQTIKDSDFEAPEGLVDVLRPYQLYGFRWLSTLAQAGFGGILADEMGLGKTVQMLAFILAQRDGGLRKPALVVCPASLVYNWKDECRRFTPELTAQTVAGTLSQRKAMLKDMTADLYITSYDLLKRDITLYDGIEFSTIVLDEAQYVKNQRAAVSKAVRVLKGDRRFALTGTPIENRLSELWSIFDFLMPGFLYTANEFAARFEGPIMKQKDADAATRLSRMTGPFILRRKKADVLKDLPEKLEEVRSTEMAEDQRKLYDAQLVRMKALLDASGDSGEDKLRILAEITRLRQLCCDPSLLFDDYNGTSAKRSACLELIQNAMDAGHRMLVFSQFTSMLSLLAADLNAAKIPFFTLTGSTPKLERIRLVNAFNDGETPVFLISLKAGGTGLNLTGADVVIHYDPWWNLAVQNQATDRAHRIGQTKQVTVIKLIGADTIEERIVQLQETKRELADAIISGQNTSLMSLSKEELMELLG